MKKVCFIMPSLVGGGAERVVSVIANSLCESGFDVTIALQKYNLIDYTLDKRIKINTSLISEEKSGLKKYIDKLIKLRTFIKDNNNSIFISFLHDVNMYLIVASIGLNSKIIVSERNDPYSYIKGILKIVINVLYSFKSVKKVIFQTNGAREFYCKKVQKKGLIILNPVKSNLPSADLINYKKEIVTVGRLTKQKNYKLLLDAFSEFHNSNKDYVLKIFGQGELDEQLQQYAFELGIKDNVYFEGFCTDVHNQIKNAAIFTISSDYEGLSNALLEAMAIGLPCISTDSPPGGARMVIKNNYNGILTEVGNKQQLIKAMCKLSSDREFAKKLGINAKKISDKISEPVICRQWKEIIDKL